MLQRKIPTSKTILHSIPIGSIIVLLLLLGFLISPNIYYSNNSVYAVEESNASDNVNNSANNNTSTYANDTDSSTSLIIGGAEMNEVVDASVGEVAYRKHTVTISASKLKSYTLFISGPEGLNGETVITGANGNTPTDMPKNSWGYAYGQDGSENDMTYSSFTNNAELIDSKLEPESTIEDTDFTKNLIFAVKFGNAIAGHYTGTVTLSLAAEPKEVTSTGFGGITNMQDMTASICDNAKVGDTTNLVDTRGGGYDNDGTANSYTVTKLEDGRCWMTQNLKLDISKASSLDSNNTNIATGTTWPSKDLTASGFSNSSTQPVWNNGTGVTNSGNWKSEYGYYYNWCAATADSCNSATSDNEAVVSASICPRGWRLPTNGEQAILDSKGGAWEIVDNIKGRTVGGGFFPAAGDIANGSLVNSGVFGNYWSSTAYDSGNAYLLGLSEDFVDISNGSLRDIGASVRCVADDQPKTEDEAIEITKGFGGIKKLQDMTSDICGQTDISIGTTGQLYDSRDLNIYDVAKLDDGKCWMTQNLRITGDSIKAKDPNNTTGTITSADSNVSSNYNIPASSEPSSFTANSVHYANSTANGAYYGWGTATAGTLGSSYSICPRGWKLPIKAQYDSLLSSAGISSNAAGSTKIRGTPYNFPYAGSVFSGSLGNVGSDGYYWSSTAYGTDFAYYLGFNSSSVDTGLNLRYYGFSVRCIAP